MWFGISTPLILLGAFYGFRKGFNHPVRTNKIPRQVPDQLWYMRSRATILMSGAIPFLVILLELFFIMKSLWKVDQYYYMFGFLGLVSSLLVLTCVEMTIVVIYFSLSSEQWQWHWRAFLVSGSSALYIFAYSCYYYTSVLEFEDFLSTVLYFTYSLLGCFVYWLCTGTLGFLVVHAFILKIYSSVKID